MRAFFNNFANPVVQLLLRSPLHAILSRSVMLITVTGRRTGAHHTLPVQYVRRGDTVYVFSPGDRRWWRNLNDGGPVTVRIGNEIRTGVGDVLRGSAAADVGAHVEGTSVAKAAHRFPDGVIVRVRLDLG